jgi:hypothetical protein
LWKKTAIATSLLRGLSLRFKIKLAVAFVVLGLLVLSVYAVQWVYLSQPANTKGEKYILDETFTAHSFLYGPQSWVPYASKMSVMPGVDQNSNGTYYLMFVDLNATSKINSTFPCVRVDYSFSGLNGTAAFHVYGYFKSNQGISWTNRVKDSGGGASSGFYVSTQLGNSNVLADAQVMPNINHITVKVSNKAGAAFNDYGNNTYYLRFEKEEGGLNALHITANPKNLNGNVTTTTQTTGTFFVDSTGSKAQDDFVLLVAVNGFIGDDFRLTLKSSVPS